MVKKQSHIGIKKSKSPSFKRKLERAALKKTEAARIAHRSNVQGPRDLPPGERNTSSPESANTYLCACMLKEAVQFKLMSLEPSAERVRLESGASICPVSFTRETGGFNAHLEDNGDHALVHSRLGAWLMGKREVTLRRGTTVAVITL